jgi:UDP-N-acetylmuramyl pentapeptide phosphotransferase/UDP-N-acetylglucosamine-1-phosphate transferase
MILHLWGIALGTAGVSAAVSVLIVLSQGWHGKHTLDHDVNGVQKFHTTAVPRIGGIAVLAAIACVLLFSHYFVPNLLPEDGLVRAALLLVAGLPVFLSGIIEDVTKKVSVRARLLASIISALTASWLLGATIDELNIWGIDSLLTWMPFALLVTAVTVSGGVNAINIIDGFNGLAACTVVIMLSALGVIAWNAGDMLVAQLAMLGLGAALGFLAVNYPTGRLFLGDGGAYFLGFWAAELVVLLLVRNVNVNAWQVLSVCAYPVIEVLYSIYRRRVLRQASPGSPDGLHLHTLVYRRVVSRFVSPHRQPWMRNATVVCVMAPWIGGSSLLSVMFGQTVIGAMLVVTAQVMVYMVVYARLVRGHWGTRLSGLLSRDDDVSAEVSR